MESTKTRSHIRFRPDPNTLAWVSKTQSLDLEHVTLVDNESFKGCCLITNQESGIKRGDRVFARIGAQSPLEAEVRWVQVIEPGLYRLGLFYID
jgi:hypothetical protein